MYKIFCIIAIFLMGCARTYNVYNYVCKESTLTQNITVTAEVPKTTSVNTTAGLPGTEALP